MADAQFTGYVYVITNTINGKQYVGQTIHSIAKRWHHHKISARKSWRGCRHLAHALRKYGEAAFTIEEFTRLVNCSQDELNAAEQSAIEMLGTFSPNGYNIRHGGANGRMHDESKALIGAYQKGRKKSPEQVAKTRAALQGKTIPPETRAKIAATLRGRPGRRHSEETRKKLSVLARARCDRPGERERRSEVARRFTSDPAIRAAFAASTKRSWEVPGAREQRSEAIKRGMALSKLAVIP